MADEYLQIKVGGDLALFQALGHLLLAEEERNPGSVVNLPSSTPRPTGSMPTASKDLSNVVRKS
ncbi:hypothetical protein AB4Z38_18140 [Arthrobacter sp. 2RAF6]|uniref:hypothetical protein n=1 Tax=Arthrobacter sp. 2RAF6 TaxID=3233002 RepID=UPI003F909672